MGFEEVSMPQLKYQKEPYPPRMVSASLKMFFEQRPNRLRIEIAALHGPWLKQEPRQIFFHLTTHPVLQGHAKALLGPMESLLRHSHTLGELGQDILTFSVPYLPTRG